MGELGQGITCRHLITISPVSAGVCSCSTGTRIPCFRYRQSSRKYHFAIFFSFPRNFRSVQAMDRTQKRWRGTASTTWNAITKILCASSVSGWYMQTAIPCSSYIFSRIHCDWWTCILIISSISDMTRLVCSSRYLQYVCIRHDTADRLFSSKIHKTATRVLPFIFFNRAGYRMRISLPFTRFPGLNGTIEVKSS